MLIILTIYLDLGPPSFQSCLEIRILSLVNLAESSKGKEIFSAKVTCDSYTPLSSHRRRCSARVYTGCIALVSSQSCEPLAYPAFFRVSLLVFIKAV